MRFDAGYPPQRKENISVSEALEKKIAAIKNPKQEFFRPGRVRTPLALKITLVFFALSVVEILFIWLSIGSNQIRIIGEKSLAVSEKTTAAITRTFSETLAKSALLDKLIGGGEIDKVKDAEKLLSLMQDAKQPVRDFSLLSPEGRYLFSTKTDGQKRGDLAEKKILKKMLSALQSVDLAGQQVYATPDVFGNTMQIFLPLLSASGAEVIFYAQYPLPFIEAELRSLVRLALAIVAVIAVLQIGFGYFIYRLVVRRLKGLEASATRVALGDLNFAIAGENKDDEIGSLTRTFNQMISTLAERSERLNQSIEVLERNREILQVELEIAKDVQAGFLPEAISSRHFSGFSYYRPLGEVSGDYYDIFPVGTGSTGLVLLDVSGHGVPAALITILARSLFQNLSERFVDPAELLSQANKELVSSVKTHDYMTVFYLTIDDNNFLSYCNAGHTEAILLRKDGNTMALDATGFFIGAVEEMPIPLRTVRMQLTPGDRILLYTDGFTEARNKDNEFYSSNRVLACAEANAGKSLEELHNLLVADFHKFVGRENLRDDVTLLVLEIGGKK